MLKFTKVGLNNSILLDIFNTREAAEELDNVVAHVSGKTTEVSKRVDVGRVFLEKLQGTIDKSL